MKKLTAILIALAVMMTAGWTFSLAEESFWAQDGVEGTVWMDDRATLEVIGDGTGFKVLIHWSNSAFDATEWNYLCVLEGETLKASHVTCDHVEDGEDGTSERINVYEKDCEAVFTENERGQIVITGAGDDMLEGKAFDRMEDDGDASGLQAEIQLLGEVFRASEELLFETENVTMTGQVNFSLDGAWFKTADAEYIQDGEDSLWKLILTSPRAEGGERVNGFTVVANGERIFAMEVYHPGTFRTGTDSAQSTILRRTVQMDLMVSLVKTLLEQPDLLQGSGTVESVGAEDGGKEIRIRAGGDVPALVNSGLNVLAQYAAKRYFATDYEHVQAQHMMPLEYYITVTQGILAATKSLALKEADLLFTLDEKGQLEGVSGKIAVVLTTGQDGEKTLDVSLDIGVSGRGESIVKEFNPADYGVEKPDGGENGLPGGQEEPAEPEEEGSLLDEETAARVADAARTAWARAGREIGDDMIVTVRDMDGYSYTEFRNEDSSAMLDCFRDQQGLVLEMHNMVNDWQGDVEYTFSPYPDEKLVSEESEKVLAFIADLDPELREKIEKLQVQWWYENGENLYLCLMEDPIAQDWDGILVVVRVRPDWQIEYYSCIANG